MGIKRVNFNMASECHALLKSLCAIKGITVSEYCYQLIASDFAEHCRKDPQIRQLLTTGEYPEDSNAGRLKNEILSEFTFE